ncbi:MAG: phosphatidylglycerophosphatase A [Nitrosomonadales bacterium]|nr:phosphatidylglycerophosphatase A [Nitrosomonadales bacterium]
MVDIKFLIGSFWHLLALGFGSGLSKKAPGTLGSLIAFPLYGLISPLSIEIQLGFVVTLFFLGIHASDITSRRLKLKDPSCIVIDEIVAMMLILIFIEPDAISFVIAFILFRFFDIKKPFPISWIEKKFTGGLGIMLDDIAAAVPCLIIMQLFYITNYAV